MASIIKRKSKYSVVYYYIDSKGEKRQHWETCNSHKEALIRKAEVAHKINEGTFIPPTEQKICDFLVDFVSLYGEKQWGVSTYDSNTSLTQACVPSPTSPAAEKCQRYLFLPIAAIFIFRQTCIIGLNTKNHNLFPKPRRTVLLFTLMI